MPGVQSQGFISFLTCLSLVVLGDAGRAPARAPDTQDDTPPSWTRWPPKPPEGYDLSRGEGYCSTVEAARAYARSRAREYLAIGLAQEEAFTTTAARRDTILNALEHLFEDRADYMVTERDGVFHGYALVRLQTQAAKDEIARIPKSVQRPAAAWTGESWYAPSAASTVVVSSAQQGQRGNFVFHFAAEPSAQDVSWYLDRVVIDNTGGSEASWGFDVSVNNQLLWSLPRTRLDDRRRSTCWPGGYGIMPGTDGNFAPSYMRLSMGSTPTANHLSVRVNGYRFDP